MVKLAILGDTHSNLEATVAVLNDAKAEGAVKFYFAGDAVGYGANPNEVLALLANFNATVKGNHDFLACVGKMDHTMNEEAATSISWTREQLADDKTHDLLQLPIFEYICPTTVLVHGTLEQGLEFMDYIRDRRDSEISFARMAALKLDLCFNAHTHFPTIYVSKRDNSLAQDFNNHMIFEGQEPLRLTEGYKYIVNVGSVGQPRDWKASASYVIYDPEARTVTFRRVDYPVFDAAAKIVSAGLPVRNAWRIVDGGALWSNYLKNQEFQQTFKAEMEKRNVPYDLPKPKA